MEAPNRATVMDAFSDALTRCEEVWRDIGLPDEDREQRRQSYFSALLNEVSEFRQSQEAYRETVERQIVTLTRQLRVTAAALEEEDSLEVPQRATKYETLQAISTLQDGLGQELQRRVSLAEGFYAQISDAADALGEAVPDSLSVLMAQKTYPRTTLEALENAVAEYSSRTRPLIERCVEEANAIAEVCRRLGRDPQTEFSGVQAFILSYSQPTQAKPRFLPELCALRGELDRVLESRAREVSSLRARVVELQNFLSEVERELQGVEGMEDAGSVENAEDAERAEQAAIGEDIIDGAPGVTGPIASGVTGIANTVVETTTGASETREAPGAPDAPGDHGIMAPGMASRMAPGMASGKPALALAPSVDATDTTDAIDSTVESYPPAQAPTPAPRKLPGPTSPALGSSASLYLSALVESSVSRDTAKILLDGSNDLSDKSYEGLKAELDRLERRKAKRMPMICQKLQRDIQAIRRSMFLSNEREAPPISLECSEERMQALLRERKQLQDLKLAFDHVFRVIGEYDQLVGLFRELIGVMTDPRRFSGKGREVSRLVQREDSLKRKVNLRLPYKMAEVLQLYRNFPKVLSPETRAMLEGTLGGESLNLFGGRDFEAEIAAICKEDMSHGTRAIEKRLVLCMKDPRSRQLLNEVAAGERQVEGRVRLDAPGASDAVEAARPGTARSKTPRATSSRAASSRTAASRTGVSHAEIPQAATPRQPDRPRTAMGLANSRHGVTFAQTPRTGALAYARTPADAVLASRVESVRRIKEARTPSRVHPAGPRGQARVDDQLSASSFREGPAAASRGPPSRTRIPVLSSSVLNKTPDARGKRSAGQGISSRLSAGPERVSMK